MTTVRGSDRGRTAVYAAEEAAFEGTNYETLTELTALRALAAGITAAAWWTAGQVAVVSARADAAVSTTYHRAGDTPVIRLAASQMTRATITHELAHVLAGVHDGHGERFRRAHVDIVSVAFGGVEANWLAEAYASMRLRLGARAWPPPPPHASGRAVQAAAG